MQKRILMIILCIGCFACKNGEENPAANEMAFDQAKWQTKVEPDYLYRDKMLKDLMDSNMLKHLTQAEIIDQLGQPTRIDSAYLFYEISRERAGFLTLHAKTLVIKISNDSTANKVMIHE